MPAPTRKAARYDAKGHELTKPLIRAGTHLWFHPASKIKLASALGSGGECRQEHAVVEGVRGALGYFIGKHQHRGYALEGSQHCPDKRVVGIPECRRGTVRLCKRQDL